MRYIYLALLIALTSGCKQSSNSPAEQAFLQEAQAKGQNVQTFHVIASDGIDIEANAPWPNQRGILAIRYKDGSLRELSSVAYKWKPGSDIGILFAGPSRTGDFSYFLGHTVATLNNFPNKGSNLINANPAKKIEEGEWLMRFRQAHDVERKQEITDNERTEFELIFYTEAIKNGEQEPNPAG